MIEYKILVKNSDGDNIGEFQTFRKLQFGKRLNNYGSCSFEVPVSDPKVSSLLALRLYTVWIYRIKDGDETLLWSGEQASRSANLDEKGDNWAQITCYDWLEQLNSRYTVNEKIYSFQDGSLIAKDLIDVTQADDYGDLGITFGTMESTTWREKTYTNQDILDALTSLANLDNGFDFELNNFKVFSIKNFIGLDRSDTLVLELGINIKKITYTEDFSKPATRALILGNTGDVGDSIRIERNDVTNEELYGLREYLYNESEVSELATLEATGDTVLAKNKLPLLTVSLDLVRNSTPTIEDFSLGDVLRLKIQKGIYNVDEKFRIFEWGISYGTDNTETLNLTLGNFRTEVLS